MYCRVTDQCFGVTHLLFYVEGNATVLSEGKLGSSNQTMTTYFFRDRIYLDPYEVTVTVLKSGTLNSTNNYS